MDDENPPAGAHCTWCDEELTLSPAALALLRTNGQTVSAAAIAAAIQLAPGRTKRGATRPDKG